MAEEAADDLIRDLRDSGLSGPDDLIEQVESNGGWRHWADDLKLTIIDSKALTAAARHHSNLNIQTSWKDDNAIRDWIKDKVEDEAFIDAPDVPEEEPEELVNRILNGGEL
jgi:hypothetical protein